MKKHLYFAISLVLSVPLHSSASDAPWGSVANEAIDQCRHISSNVDRLYCYDHLFKASVNTNIQVEQPTGEKTDEPAKTINPFVEAVKTIEDRRQIDNSLFLSHIQYGINFVEKNGQYDPALMGQLGEAGYNVYLTKPSLNASQTFKPILAISCINDITSLQVVLPKPHGNVHSTEVILSNRQGVEEKQRWRVLMEGQVLSAPRGLESIRYIQNILNYDVINIQTTLNGQTVQAAFDLHDLRKEIKPLSIACHWMGR